MGLAVWPRIFRAVDQFASLPDHYRLDWPTVYGSRLRCYGGVDIFARQIFLAPTAPTGLRDGFKSADIGLLDTHADLPFSEMGHPQTRRDPELPTRNSLFLGACPW